MTYLTQSILPAVVLHTVGNIYSGIALWRRGQAEWQASAEPASMIWQTGADASFWIATLALLIAAVAMTAAYAMLARSARNRPRDDRSVLI